MSRYDEILDFAIAREAEAADFYTELAENTRYAWVRETLLAFAQEERGHQMRLQAVRAGKPFRAVGGGVPDLKIGDYLVDVVPSPTMDFQEVLILAMKREKAAFRLYSDLAGRADDPALRELFLALAQEEAKHKLRFELEYDEHVLKEN